MSLAWRTLVEAGILGFHIERRQGDGAWQRISTVMIPNMHAEGQPQDYVVVDDGVLATESAEYRLLAIDIGGSEQVMGTATPELPVTVEILLRGSRATIRLHGPPIAEIEVESTVGLGEEWLHSSTVRLDVLGDGQVDIPVDAGDKVRLVRVRLLKI